MAADNDLAAKAKTTIDEMTRMDLPENVSVLIQHDPGRLSILDFSNKPTERFRILNHSHREKEYLGETNCGDPMVLREFLEWGLKQCPAERTIAVIWSHGTGAKDDDVFKTIPEEIADGIARLFRGETDPAEERTQVIAIPDSSYQKPAADSDALSADANFAILRDLTAHYSPPARLQKLGICSDYGLPDKVVVAAEENLGKPEPIRICIDKKIPSSFPKNRYPGVRWAPISICPDRSITALMNAAGSAPESGSVSKGIGNDQQPGCNKSHDYLTNVELGQAVTLPDRKLDLIVFDACLMNAFEVLYELRNRAEIVIGSESTIPTDGLPYGSILEKISSLADADSATVAESVLLSYRDAYPKPDRVLSLAAIRTSALEDAAIGLDGFAGALIGNAPLIRGSLEKILGNVQKFGFLWQEQMMRSTMEYVDLHHFVSLCRDKIPVESIQSKSESLLPLLDKAVIANFSTCAMDQPQTSCNVRGLSMYFPASPPGRDVLGPYAEMEFNKQYPNWLTLITRFYSST